MPTSAAFSAQRANAYLDLLLGRRSWSAGSIGSAVLQRVRTGPLVGFCAIVAGLLVVISMLTSGPPGHVVDALVGLFNSIMFPSIFTLGIAHMGPLTGKASGLLVQAIVGGAIIPLGQGAITDRSASTTGFILPLLCYLFIIYYGFIGSRPTGAQAELVVTAA